MAQRRRPSVDSALDWKMTRTIAHYERIEQIGEGTYGQVYRAKCLDTGRIVALKKIRVHHGGYWGMPPTVIREIKILKRLSHSNLVKMYEVCSSKGVEYLEEHDVAPEKKSSKTPASNYDYREGYKGNIYLVLEYVSHDLTGLMDVAYRFSEQEIKCIFQQLLQALHYMHSHKYIHRDIKSSNILIDSHFRVKLADFGLARNIEPPMLDNIHDRGTTSHEFTNKVITLWYRPPEILLGATRYGPAVDMWSAGCILAELMLGRPLFTGKTEMEQLQQIFDLLGTPTLDSWEGFTELRLMRTGQVTIEKQQPSKLRDKYSHKMPTVAMNLMEKLLELDPNKRLTASRALSSRYFLTEPRAPSSPQDLGTLELGHGGGHFHEFQTKKKRREAKALAKHASNEARAAGCSSKEAEAEYEAVYRECMKKVAEEGNKALLTDAERREMERRDKEKIDEDLGLDAVEEEAVEKTNGQGHRTADHSERRELTKDRSERSDDKKERSDRKRHRDEDDKESSRRHDDRKRRREPHRDDSKRSSKTDVRPDTVSRPNVRDQSLPAKGATMENRDSLLDPDERSSRHVKEETHKSRKQESSRDSSHRHHHRSSRKHAEHRDRSRSSSRGRDKHRHHHKSSSKRDQDSSSRRNNSRDKDSDRFGDDRGSRREKDHDRGDKDRHRRKKSSRDDRGDRDSSAGKDGRTNRDEGDYYGPPCDVVPNKSSREGRGDRYSPAGKDVRKNRDGDFGPPGGIVPNKSSRDVRGDRYSPAGKDVRKNRDGDFGPPGDVLSRDGRSDRLLPNIGKESARDRVGDDNFYGPPANSRRDRRGQENREMPLGPRDRDRDGWNGGNRRVPPPQDMRGAPPGRPNFRDERRNSPGRDRGPAMPRGGGDNRRPPPMGSGEARWNDFPPPQGQRGPPPHGHAHGPPRGPRGPPPPGYRGGDRRDSMNRSRPRR